MSAYSVFARYYDSLTSNVAYAQKAEYLNQLIEKYAPQANLLVDLACGTGNLSIELSKAGFDVIGIDCSYEMLSEAMQKTYESQMQILYLCQRMQELDLYGTIDVAVCVLDSINHMTDLKDVLETFKRVSLFLNPDGLFIFDVNTPYKHQQVLANNTFVYDCKDVYCVWQNQLQGDVVDISLDFFERDEDDSYYRSEEHFSERAYSCETIEQFLKESHLQVLAMYDDYTFGPVTETTERIVYVTQKCGFFDEQERITKVHGENIKSDIK